MNGPLCLRNENNSFQSFLPTPLWLISSVKWFRPFNLLPSFQAADTGPGGRIVMAQMKSGNLISYLVVRGAQPMKYFLFFLPPKYLKGDRESLSPFAYLSQVNLNAFPCLSGTWRIGCGWHYWMKKHLKGLQECVKDILVGAKSSYLSFERFE